MSDVYDIIRSRRSFRAFLQKPVPAETLRRIVDAARLAPSSANRQILKFATVTDPALVGGVFDATRWAGYIPDDGGRPTPDKRPAAFAVVLHDKTVSPMSPDTDAGAAAENMMLAAWAEGVGSCWIGSVDREKVAALLKLPAAYAIHTVIAFGYPAHESVVEELTDTVKYRRDEDGTYHVPKRALSDVWLTY